MESHEFALEWIHDFEAFQAALVEHGAQGGRGGYEEGEPNYMDSLMNSMSLVLDEFYNHLTVSITHLDAVRKRANSGLCRHTI